MLKVTRLRGCLSPVRRGLSTHSSVAPHAPPLLSSTVRELRALLESSPAPWTVLSGAGLSTASGIPDYRSPGRGPYKPMTHQEFVTSRARRRRYWARSAVGYERVRRARPSQGHQAVRRLEDDGLVGAVITQNVDSLHARAGSRDAIELHGALRDVVCLACGHRESRETMQRWLEEDNPRFTEGGGWRASPPVAPGLEVPARPDGDVDLEEAAYADFAVRDCPSCGSFLMPDLVFFGGSVPRDRVDRAREAVAASGGLLCVGTSLTVWSGLRFARQASRDGQPVAVVAVGPTRADELATWRAHASVDELLHAVAAAGK